MTGNSYVRFLGGNGVVIRRSNPTMSNIPDFVISGTSRYSQSVPNHAPAAHTCRNDWRDASDMD